MNIRFNRVLKIIFLLTIFLPAQSLPLIAEFAIDDPNACQRGDNTSNNIDRTCRFNSKRLAEDSSWRKLKRRLDRKISTCGIKSNIVDSVLAADPSIELDLPVGKKRFLPILMSDKSSRQWSCYRTKIRVACVDDVKATEDKGYELTLRALPTGHAIEDVIKIRPNGSVDYGEANSGQFFLIKERFVYLDKVRNGIANFRCNPNESNSACRRSLLYASEWLMSLELRIHRKAPFKTGPSQRRQDKDFLREHLGTLGLNDFEQQLSDVTIRNETGTISPFEMVDAVLANSGLSFGPHQYDIGVNPEAATLFSKLAEKKINSDDTSSELAYYLQNQCLNEPMRKLSVRDLKVAYDNWPTLTDLVREQKKLVTETYRGWLASSNREYIRLQKQPLFKDYPQLAALLINIGHQYGPGHRRKAMNVIQNGADQELSLKDQSCRVLDYLLGTAFGRSNPTSVRDRLQATVGVSCEN